MPALSIWIGLLLVLLGVLSYVLTGGASPTAFIPAAFGLVLTTLGYAGRREAARRQAMHGAAIVSLLGFLGSMSGIPKILTIMGGGELERPAAAVAQGLMALLCLIFLVFAVRSFIVARRARKN